MVADAIPPLSEHDAAVYDALVPADHYLRRVKHLVDFERFRPLLVAAYSAHMGRPPIDPVRMLQFEFLRFHYRLSDRQVMERTKTDVAFRYFLDLGLHETVPDHTNGTHFRQRIGPERCQQVFQALVTQAREHGLVRDRLRLKDATHLHADAADLYPLALAAQVRERLLQAAAPLFPAWVAEQRALVEALRQTTAEWSDDERLVARLEQVRQMAAEARDRLAGRPADRADTARRERLERALAVVAQWLGDHADPAAGDRLASAVDPDARVGKHGSFFVGYLLDVAIDPASELITAVNVLPGNGAEAADARTLIAQEEAAQGNDIAELSIDGAGYNGPVLRELMDPAGLDLVVTVPPPPEPVRSTFGSERFALRVLDNGVSELTCPHGQTTRQRERVVKDTGYKYIFSAGKCRGCPLREQCLQNPRSGRGRTVIRNDYAEEYRQVRARAQTPAYAQTRREHPKIERKLGELARHQGARRARYRGRAKVLYQAVVTALVVNVKRMVKLLGGVGPPSPRTETVRAELAGT